MTRRPPREVVRLRCEPGWCAPVVLPGARALARPGVEVGVASADPDDTGATGSASTTTKALAAVAFAVVVGTIVYASKSAAEDFA